MVEWSEMRNTSRPGIAAVIERLVEASRRYRCYRETLSELESLSDHELRDIGIGRWDVRGAAYRAVYGQSQM